MNQTKKTLKRSWCSAVWAGGNNRHQDQGDGDGLPQDGGRQQHRPADQGEGRLSQVRILGILRIFFSFILTTYFTVIPCRDYQKTAGDFINPFRGLDRASLNNALGLIITQLTRIQVGSVRLRVLVSITVQYIAV